MAAEIDRYRRLLLKSAVAGGILDAVLSGGLLPAMEVQASEWNRAAFTAKSLAEAVRAAGAMGSSESGSIAIKAPDIADNGAQVPIEVLSTIPGSQTVSVFVDKNPMPLAASVSFFNGALAQMRLQIKMSESSRIRVVVKSTDGKTYHANREVKVTLGGCGA